MVFVLALRRLRAGLHRTGVAPHWLVGASVALAVAIVGLGAGLLYQMRGNERVEAVQTAENLLATITADLARNIELYDLSLQAVIDNLKNPEIDQVRDETRQVILFDRSATAKYLGRIHVLDEDGKVVLDSRRTKPEPRMLSDRDYFQTHSRQDDLGMHVGRPFVSEHGHSVISISRRLNKPDGSFNGVVAGMLRLEYVQDLFRRIKLPRGTALTLVRQDGIMLAREPMLPQVVGRDLGGTEIFAKGVSASAGNFEAIAGLDGVLRLYTFQRVEGLPLVMMVGQPTAEVYAAWWHQVWTIGTLVFVLALATIGLALFAARELSRRARAEQRLAALVSVDALTGVANRRAFDAALRREGIAARRNDAPLALLMIDADKFKDFNDRFGHQAGDRALVDIAECIASSCRDSFDVAARYGGEEFALLLPNTTLAEGVQVAERIRQKVARLGEKSETGFPTVSVGVASLAPADIGDGAALVQAADTALYEAKRSGRNRVVPANFDQHTLLLVA